LRTVFTRHSFTKATKFPPDYNVGGPLYNSIINKEGDTMDNEYIQEIFNQFHAGEIDTLELMEELETARFDGDIIDYL
jgi:hypothetical protein